MPDPRDELAYADLANEPGLLPPREPLRIRVSPYDTPPPSDTGWGGFGAGGRPEGRLFEPDLEPAPAPTGPGFAEGGPQPPWQGGRLFEPDQSSAPPKPQFQPGLLSLGNVARGIGSLVQGAGNGASAPPTATAPPFVAPPRGRSNAPFDPMAGVRPDSYPKTAQPSFGENLATGVGHAATEVLQEPYNMIRAGQDIAVPGATDQQVQRAREQEAAAATNLTSNMIGANAPFAAARPATAGVFGGRLARGVDPNKEKLAETMLQNGVPAPQIWKETGMVKFADGKWAHEIPDIAASYKGNVDQIASKIFDQQNPKRAGQYGSDTNVLRSQIARQDALLKMQGKAQLYLEDVIDHPELFNAYPELRKMPVSHDAFMHASGGYLPRSQFDPEAKIFYREEGPAGQMARGKTFDTLLHEIQHAIQQIEGMAKGSNPAKDLALTPGTPANAIYLDMISQIPPGLSASRKKELSNAFAIQAGGQAYSRSAGENVANITAVRKDLTPEQASAVFPPGQFRTPMSEQVVEFNKHTGFPPEQLPLLSGQQAQMGGVLNPAPREMQMSAPKPQPGGAKFPQYAERYPEVGPGVPTIDPKTKKEYLAKQLTPEAEAFAKEVDRVNKAMAKEGYTPYFDPAKREHVDPAHYPRNVDTTTIVPKKQATIDKDLETIASEDARTRLRGAYQRGTEMPNTKDWYAMKQLEAEFIKELGPEAGRKAFQDKIATSMAATTGGADPLSNWRMAHYGNYLREKGLPYPGAAHEMPYPIGGRYASGNMAMHQKIFDEGGFAALGAANPKRHNFSQNFTGNRGAATMDEQMTSLMTPGVNMPPPGKYGLYENVLGEEARKVGVQPQNYQDVAWSGAKNLKDPRYTSGQPFIQTINESIERTHRLTGMPREEIVRRGIIRSEIPMYGMAGPNPIGSLVDPQGYNR